MSDKNKPHVLREYYLKRLRLPPMLREYVSMAEVCSQDRSDFATCLLRLVEREILSGKNGRPKDGSRKPDFRLSKPSTHSILRLSLQLMRNWLRMRIRESQRGYKYLLKHADGHGIYFVNEDSWPLLNSFFTRNHPFQLSGHQV